MRAERVTPSLDISNRHEVYYPSLKQKLMSAVSQLDG